MRGERGAVLERGCNFGVTKSVVKEALEILCWRVRGK